MQFNCHIRLGKLLSREFNIRGAAKAASSGGTSSRTFTSHFCRPTADAEQATPLASRKAARRDPEAAGRRRQEP